MSAQEDLTSLARDIFAYRAAIAPPDYWDWQTLANNAYTAATQFFVVNAQQSQSAPQQSVQPSEPGQSQSQAQPPPLPSTAGSTPAAAAPSSPTEPSP